MGVENKMQKLIKLEIKKHKVIGYWKAVLIINVFITALTCSIGFIEPIVGESDFGGSVFDLMTFNSILTSAIFIVFSAVVLARIVIEEYRNKTIQLLFTYPISRKKLMQAKLILVFSVTVISVVFSSITQYLALSVLNPWLNLSSEIITPVAMLEALPKIILSALAVAGIGLIPLFFGMLNKSTITTIICGVVMASILNSNAGGDSYLLQFAVVQLLLSFAGIVIGILSYYKIDQKDVL